MKKITLVIILILLNTEVIYSQNKKINFGLNLFPNYTNAILSQGRIPAFSSNLFLQYSINEKSKLSMGIGYQFYKERQDKTDVFLQTPDPSFPSAIQFYYPHHNLEIPLMFQYYFTKRFYGIGGISGVFNIKNQITEIKYFADGSTTKTNSTDHSTNYRKMNLTLNLGVGFDYVKRENISLFLQPFFQLALMPITKTTPNSFSSLDYSAIGIVTGIRF